MVKMIKLNCMNCNKEFERKETELKKYNKHFCCRDCCFEYNKNNEDLVSRFGNSSIKTQFKKNWQKTPEGKKIIEKRVKTLSNKEMSNPEKKLYKLIIKENLPLEFVGDGKLIIGTKCPDFIYINDGKKIIEVFSDYWHRDDVVKYWHQTEKGTISYYNSLGYNVLVIWENELKDLQRVKEKILDWINSSLEIKKIPKWSLDYLKDRSLSEFDGEIGQTLAFLIKMCEEYEALKAKFFQGDMQLQLLSNVQSEDTSESPKSISGQPIKPFGGKDVKNK